MAKLFCAVVGVGSVFPVDIDISETVGDLKKKIKEENPNSIHFDAALLKLYLAREGGAWLNSQDDELEKLMSGEISDRVKNLMRKELLLKETRNLNNDAYFGKTFERAEDDIHVLVELPSPDVAARGIDVAPFEQMKMAVNEAFEERDRKRSVYSISTCPRSKEILLKQQLGLEYSTVRVNEVIDDSINGYQWSALPEKHPDQRKAYMKYVEEHLGDGLKPSGEQKDFLKDVAGKRGLLDCDDPSRLPFKVKGTADMMIIDESANRMNNVFAGLRFVIEVKKDRPSMNEQWQLLLELVAADLKSETSCAPVGLLTNLNDYWFFLWFAPDNRIARMVLTCPANGFKTIIEVLKERSGPTRDGDFPMRVAFLDSSLPLKRQKLPRSAIGPDDAAAEMLERYELMADELDPEFLQQQRIDYAFDLIRRMPIHSSMYT